MKTLSLTSSLVAAMTFSIISASAQPDTTLRSQISLKEKELVEIQKELATLRSKLASKPTTPTAKRYTVTAGDTVSSIARRHGVSAKQVMNWNKITDPTKLRIGQSLVIGFSSTVKSSKKAAKIETVTKKPAVTTKAKEYVIQRGDTFYSIARRHKMTVTQLRALNPDVSTHLISAGQSLNVTGKPTSEQVAKVKADRKAANIAKARTLKEKAAKTAKAKKLALEKKALLAQAAEKQQAKEEPRVTLKEVKKADPTPEVTVQTEKKEVAIAANSTPPAPPVIDQSPSVNSLSTNSKPKTMSAIILTSETTFDEFAEKHGTTTDQLNALNGWNLPKATVLARGSEISVPQ